MGGGFVGRAWRVAIAAQQPWDRGRPARSCRFNNIGSMATQTRRTGGRDARDPGNGNFSARTYPPLTAVKINTSAPGGTASPSRARWPLTNTLM